MNWADKTGNNSLSRFATREENDYDATMEEKMDNGQWLIWSFEHNQWWKENWHGYTQEREDAGRYSIEEAIRIVGNANIAAGERPNEAMLPDYD